MNKNREDKTLVSLFINDKIANILTTKELAKKKLTLANINKLQSFLGKNFIVCTYFIKESTNEESKIMRMFKEPRYPALLFGEVFDDFYTKTACKLKDRGKYHALVMFSDKDISNKNNYSYFYNPDSLLSGSYIDSLVEELKLQRGIADAK